MQILRLVCLSLILTSVTTLRGQTPVGRGWDLGANLGLAYYTGDASGGLTSLRLNPKVDLGLYHRSNLRFTWLAELSYQRLSGHTEDAKTVYPSQPQSFKAHGFGLLFGGEYNWYRHTLGYDYLESKRWTPFVGLGLGAMLLSDEKTILTPQVSIRLGLKYIINERLRLRVQYAWHYCMSDRLDALGGNGYLDTPIGLKGVSLRHGDSFGSLSLGLVYTLGQKQIDCN